MESNKKIEIIVYVDRKFYLRNYFTIIANKYPENMIVNGYYIGSSTRIGDKGNVMLADGSIMARNVKVKVRDLSNMEIIKNIFVTLSSGDIYNAIYPDEESDPNSSDIPLKIPQLFPTIKKEGVTVNLRPLPSFGKYTHEISGIVIHNLRI